MTAFVQLSQKFLRFLSDYLQKKYQYQDQEYWLFLRQKLLPVEMVQSWMIRFHQPANKSSEISIDNPLSFNNRDVGEEVLSLKTTNFMERVANLPIKLKKWVAWRFKQVKSLPSQIAWGFMKIPLIEKNLLYPRYLTYLREHHSKLPVLDSIESKVVDELQQKGICITSLESLGILNTQEFVKAAKKLFQELMEVSLLPTSQGKYEILATSAQLIKHKELFQWGLNDRLLKIVETYLGLPVAYDGLLSVLSVADGREIGQRAWHRDREDRHMIKICVYLNEVVDNGGPFQCLQPEINSLLCNGVKNRYKSVFNEELETFSPTASDGITTCKGPFGTVIFVDTALYYHRGKPPTELNRSAIFFSYFSRQPWHPFFCQRSPLSREERDHLTKGMSSYQQTCVNWKDNLPWLVKLIPHSRI